MFSCSSICWAWTLGLTGPTDPPLAASMGLSGWDLAVLSAYLLATVAWGAWPRGKAATEESYLLGGRNLAWPLLLASIIATETSTVTFLSLPGQSFAERGDCTFLQITLGYVVGRVAVAALLLPSFFRGAYFTAYGLLEERFGGGVRAAASLLFLLCRTLADGLRLYLTALALHQALGWDVPWCIVVVTGATALYATLGGVSSVVWNDCLQLAVYLVGALIAAWLIVKATPGGLDSIVRFGAETGRWRVFDPGLGLTGSRVTFWSGLVGGAFLSIASHGVDHLMVQRYLCARTRRSAMLALVLSGPAVALQFALFLAIGVGLAAEASATGAADPGIKPDQAFAAFLARGAPIGVGGLLFAAVLAAAMSTLSSSLNASAGVLLKDLLQPMGFGREGSSGVRLARAGTALFAALQAAVALAAVALELDSAVISAVLSIAGFTTGVLVGLFALAFFPGGVSPRAALMGLAAGFGVCVAVQFRPDWFGVDPSLAWPWNTLLASTATLVAGLAANQVAPPSRYEAAPS